MDVRSLRQGQGKEEGLGENSAAAFSQQQRRVKLYDSF